jgi:hypothetical protein
MSSWVRRRVAHIDHPSRLDAGRHDISRQAPLVVASVWLPLAQELLPRVRQKRAAFDAAAPGNAAGGGLLASGFSASPGQTRARRERRRGRHDESVEPQPGDVRVGRVRRVAGAHAREARAWPDRRAAVLSLLVRSEDHGSGATGRSCGSAIATTVAALATLPDARTTRCSSRATRSSPHPRCP